MLFLEFDYIDYDFVSSPLPLKRYLDRSIDCSVSLLTVTHRYMPLTTLFFIVIHRFLPLRTIFFYLIFLTTRIQKNIKKILKPIE